jgi:hypothetical protein
MIKKLWTVIVIVAIVLFEIFTIKCFLNIANNWSHSNALNSNNGPYQNTSINVKP